MEQFRRYAILLLGLVALSSGLWFLATDGMSGGASGGILIGLMVIAFWSRGWLGRSD